MWQAQWFFPRLPLYFSIMVRLCRITISLQNMFKCHLKIHLRLWMKKLFPIKWRISLIKNNNRLPISSFPVTSECNNELLVSCLLMLVVQGVWKDFPVPIFSLQACYSEYAVNKLPWGARVHNAFGLSLSALETSLFSEKGAIFRTAHIFITDEISDTAMLAMKLCTTVCKMSLDIEMLHLVEFLDKHCQYFHVANAMPQMITVCYALRHGSMSKLFTCIKTCKLNRVSNTFLNFFWIQVATSKDAPRKIHLLETVFKFCFIVLKTSK